MTKYNMGGEEQVLLPIEAAKRKDITADEFKKMMKPKRTDNKDLDELM